MAEAAGAPATLSNVARDIIAGLGNDSPTQSQINAMSAWILSEKPSGLTGVDAASWNPLNVTVNGTPARFNPIATNIQPGNPIAQFSDLTAGIAANIGWLQGNSNANPMIALFAKPREITAGQLSEALNTPGGGGGIPWKGDVAAVLSIFPNVKDLPWLLTDTNGNASGDIGVDRGGTTPGGTTIDPNSAGPTGIGWLDALLAQISHALPRVAAYFVGALMIIIGVAIFIADDIQVKGVSLKQAAGRVAS